MMGIQLEGHGIGIAQGAGPAQRHLAMFAIIWRVSLALAISPFRHLEHSSHWC